MVIKIGEREEERYPFLIRKSKHVVPFLMFLHIDLLRQHFTYKKCYDIYDEYGSTVLRAGDLHFCFH